MPYPDSEQLPKRGYTIQAIPLRALAAAAAVGSLGLTYPDSEQIPKRGYALGSIPLRALARARSGGTSLGIAYPDREQAAKRSYVLGSVPLLALARAAVASSILPPSFPGGGGEAIPWRRDVAADDREVLELITILAHTINVWQRN